MKENGRKDPLCFGRGRQKVTVYAPTKSLPYHRIAYWLGGKRLQRSFKDGQQAREEAKALTPPLSNLLTHPSRMSEPHWRKRRREAMKRKQTPNFYAKQAVKPPSSWEFTSFWGHKGLQRRFGKVNGEKPKGLGG